jgi:nicotinamidase-related amidase
MDVQVGIVERFQATAETLEPFRTAIGAARRTGLPVTYVRVAFRPGAPEVSLNNRSFAHLAGQPGMEADSPLTQIHPAVAPEPEDVVVVKKRVSAFAGSDLDMVLRAQGIDTLVLTGIATSGVVLSTVREAADRDYRLVVLHDACLDADPEVQRVLTGKVFPRQAEVLSTLEWVERLAP